jgi:ferredoxin-NADP reductase
MNISAEKLSLSVTRIRKLTSRILVYELRSATATELPLVTAGSHLTLPISFSNGKITCRNYSICSNPNQRDFYEIAVLCDEPNRTDSELNFEKNDMGSQFECDLPSNSFHLHADASPATLIASGIGIAPIIAIAHTLAARGRRFSLHYAGDSKTEMAFVDELQSAFPRQIHFYCADENQHLDTMNLLADAPRNSFFYTAVPQKMVADIETSAHLLGIPKDQIQQECFDSEEQVRDKAVILELAYSNKLINAKADQPLLAALRDAGVDVHFDCCVGDCGTCAVKVLEGKAEHRDHVLSDAQKSEGLMCVCVSRAKGDKLVLAL